jgi:transcriptional regulator GlxA family with amidase domain
MRAEIGDYHQDLRRLLPKIHSIVRDISSPPQDRLNRVSVILSTALEAAKDDVGRMQAIKKERRVHGGLAPWQIRRLKVFVEERISSAVRCADMAQFVRLSPSHFCRAFQTSLNMTPHAYVMSRRIERACALMMTTRTPLGQIAIECGFSDQAHFNRQFRKHVAVSPGRWRRMQAPASMGAASA